MSPMPRCGSKIPVSLSWHIQNSSQVSFTIGNCFLSQFAVCILTTIQNKQTGGYHHDYTFYTVNCFWEICLTWGLYKADVTVDHYNSKIKAVWHLLSIWIPLSSSVYETCSWTDRLHHCMSTSCILYK
jgi:hypothetical protein